MVLDASALLAFLQNEPGSSTVEAALTDSAYCYAVNWSEVAQKVRAASGDWGLARALLDSYKLGVLDATAADAEWAGLRCAGRPDRGCLSLTGSAWRWANGSTPTCSQPTRPGAPPSGCTRSAEPAPSASNPISLGSLPESCR